MPTKKTTAPAKGQTIKQNVQQSLARVRNVPATKGTGIINKKGTN